MIDRHQRSNRPAPGGKPPGAARVRAAQKFRAVRKDFSTAAHPTTVHPTPERPRLISPARRGCQRQRRRSYTTPGRIPAGSRRQRQGMRGGRAGPTAAGAGARRRPAPAATVHTRRMPTGKRGSRCTRATPAPPARSGCPGSRPITRRPSGGVFAHQPRPNT
jgi:hypothetical protein